MRLQLEMYNIIVTQVYVKRIGVDSEKFLDKTARNKGQSIIRIACLEMLFEMLPQ